MASILKPKRRTADATAPTTANLVDGEIAINAVSKTIYQRVGAEVVAVANASGITWQTVSANTTMTTGNAYNVSGARNMTVGSAVVGDNYIVHAVDATVRVIAGAGREIRYANASVVSGATDALTLAKGETVWLVCNATNKLGIV